MPDLVNRRSEAGVTLIELLVAMLVGTLVMSAALGLVTSSQGATKKIGDRVDAGQRGRVALDQVTQRLRSSACLEDGKTPPIVYGDATRITYYADLDGDTIYDPEQRALEFVAGPPTILLESRWQGLAVPLAAPAPAATSSRTVLSGYDPLLAQPSLLAQPYLRYFALSTATPAVVSELAVPLSDTDRVRVARIDIAFRARPSDTSLYTPNSVAMTTSVYARTPQSNATGPRPAFSCT